VQICISLTGIDLTPETFCYEHEETLARIVRPVSFIPLLRVKNFYPEASCIEVNRILIKQWDIIGKKFNQPDEKKQVILARWRKVIFETNQNLGRFKSADEIPEDEVKERVRQFTTALIQITGFEPGVTLVGPAKNCPQSPKTHRVIKLC